ncbi:hypothetical protein ET445_01805 [Agromyces protaetiae]|uniref:Uncharacterized protein n=1 Tax=Agromyces protaetiae TaxID=2509455 RepID=A0A4P6FP44_9MICO|nr:hypothetical protein ET445_01805 [Agromyces protaetiae]
MAPRSRRRRSREASYRAWRPGPASDAGSEAASDAVSNIADSAARGRGIRSNARSHDRKAVRAGSRGRCLSVRIEPKGPSTVKWVKRIAIGLVVLFAAFYLITRPEDAATAVQGTVGAVVGGVESVGRFFTTLAG